MNLPSSQKGAMLLVFFLMLFSIGTTLFLSSVNTHQVEMRQFENQRAEMTKAKEALLAYAVNYPNFGFANDPDAIPDDEGYGRLPCPDVDNDGLADSNAMDCTNTVRGRLPESIIYGGSNEYILNNAFSGIDQQFWYVVDPDFKETADVVNHTGTGTLTIDGKSGYIAVIIAPGEQLAFQDRVSGLTNPANYLEQGNTNGNDFVNSHPADPDNFNDQVIGITLKELNDRINLEDIVHSRDREFFESYYANNSALPPSPAALATYLATTYIETTDPAWYYEEEYLDAFLADMTGPASSYQLKSSFFGLIFWAEVVFDSCPAETTKYYPSFLGGGSIWSQTGPC